MMSAILVAVTTKAVSPALSQSHIHMNHCYDIEDLDAFASSARSSASSASLRTDFLEDVEDLKTLLEERKNYRKLSEKNMAPTPPT